MSYPEHIREIDKKKYCPDHKLYKMKNALGNFVCPFCEATHG